MTRWLERLNQSCTEESHLPRGASLLLAVSGGLDSMVLLEAFSQLAPGNHWQLTIAHFNHRLRGRSSDADERLVQRQARRLRLPCRVGSADVRETAKTEGISVEMAARRLRHDFFARVARQKRIKFIVLAHHADDQVELFFLRLLRGAGREGFGGMKPSSPSPADPRLTCVRPFLNFKKAELLAFAQEEKVPFREDASNRSGDMLRNRVRNELLPLIRKRYQPPITEVTLRNMEILRAEGEVIDHLIAHGTGGVPFGKMPVAIQRRLLQVQLLQLGHAPDFTTIEKLRLVPREPVQLQPDLLVQREGNGSVVRLKKPVKDVLAKPMKVALKGTSGRGHHAGLDWQWTIQRSLSPRLPRFTPGSEWFDADKVGSEVVLRHWRPGDRFRPIGMPGSVKIQNLFVNHKVPRAERHSRTVATTPEGEIWWIEGFRIGEAFKLTSQTKRRLKWSWSRPPAPRKNSP